MIDALEIRPVSRPVSGRIRPPGSKSLTNRALVIAALAQGRSRLTGALDSQDTQVMLESLRRLGIAVDADPRTGRIDVEGCGGQPPADSADLWLENSGTSMRFLTAVCTLGRGTYRLDGNSRMRERPIGDLVSALKALGARVACEQKAQLPPLVVHGEGLPGGGVRVAADLSSQFVSALLMAAPAARETVEIRLEGPPVSQPYIGMTIAVMQRFGVNVETGGDTQFRVEPQTYRGCEYDVEPDASAASYFFAAAAITEGEVTVPGLSRNSLQGDVAFVDLLERMGCRADWQPDAVTLRGGPLAGIDVDLNAMSDTAQTLAAVAVFARGPTRIRNIAHVRHKETDRVAAVVNELGRLGIRVDEFPDGMTVYPGPVQPAVVETYDDHRMAMSFSLIGLKYPGIRIADPDCTSKTYPRYFEDLQALCGTAFV